jgi:hypothetical protein
MQSPAADLTAAFAQRIGGTTRRNQCGHDAEQDAGGQRHDRSERHDGQIERHLLEPRNEDAIAHQREKASEKQRATPRPAMHPAAASTTLSASSWRTSRDRPAPSAVRTRLRAPARHCAPAGDSRR